MTKKKNNSRSLNWFILMLAVLSSFYNVKAQSDSLQYSEEIQQDSMVQYLTPLEYAFMMHEETPWMVKVNLLSITNFGLSTLYLKGGFETRLGSSFSINMSLSSFFYEESLYSYITPDIEGRWYYNKAKKIKLGKSKSNLSGNYFALGSSYKYVIEETPPFPNRQFNFLYKSNFSINIKWGMQRRFLNKGYIDFGLTAGKHYNKDESPSYFFSTFIDAGLAFAKDKQKVNRDKLCTVLRCYETDRFIIKIDLNDLLNYSIQGISNLHKKHSITFNPNIAMEVKLGKLPISINSEFDYYSILFLETLGTYGLINRDEYTKYNFSIESRWYLNLKRRMLKGKSGNGLSANYIGLGVMNRNIIRKTESYDYGIRNIDSSTQNDNLVFITAGMQRLLSKHFYLDMNLKIGFGKISYDNKEKSNQGYILPNLRIGYRF